PDQKAGAPPAPRRRLDQGPGLPPGRSRQVHALPHSPRKATAPHGSLPAARRDPADGVPELVRRYELVWMGSIAAVAGIGLAALLTASFGARSSGTPPGLRPAAAATAVPAEPAAAKRVPVRVHAARKHAAHRRHMRVRDHAPTAKPARSIPTPART